MKRSREPEEEGPPSGALPALVATDDGPQPPDKIRELDPAAQDADCAPVATCSMPPHRDAIGFASYQDYETHHLQVHTNRCLECRKNFPSGHLLSIHIEEWHDPLVQLRRDRGEHTYSCFVEGCERKCMTHWKRRLHMIDKHMYPKNYFFSVTRDGVDSRQSLLVDAGHDRHGLPEKRRRPSTVESAATESIQTEGGPGRPPETAKDEADTAGSRPDKDGDAGVAHLTGAMSALRFLPPSVRFGRGRPGFARR